MALNDLGIAYPLGTDEFSPQADMKALADSLRGRAIVPVANTAERADKAAALSPSAANPLIVFRASATAGRELEYTTDGATWQVVDVSFDVWQSLQPESGWRGGSNIEWAREGRVAFVNLAITSSSNANTNGMTVGILPTAVRPSRTLYFAGYTQQNGYTPFRIDVLSTGHINATYQTGGDMSMGRVLRGTLVFTTR